MKILISGLGVNGMYGENLCAAFKELGHEVRFLGDQFDLRAGLARMVSYIPFKANISRRYNAYREAANKRLIQEASSFPPDFVVVVGGENMSPEIIQKIRTTQKIPVACWVTEEPAAADVYNPLAWLNYSAYTHLFVVDELWAQSLQLFNVPKFYLPFAGNSHAYRRDVLKKDIDILFVGSLFPEERHLVSGFGRAAILSYLQEASIRYAALGGGFRKIKYFFPSLRPRDIFQDANPSLCNTLYNRSKVIIYINPLLLKTDFDHPVFDIALSGNFLITDAKVNAAKLFNNELVTVTTSKELLVAVKHFLGSDGERGRICKKVQAVARERHTYVQRAQEMLKNI